MPKNTCPGNAVNGSVFHINSHFDAERNSTLVLARASVAGTRRAANHVLGAVAVPNGSSAFLLHTSFTDNVGSFGGCVSVVGGSVAYIFNSSFVGNAAIEPLIPDDIAKIYLRAQYNPKAGEEQLNKKMEGTDFIKQLDSRNALVK